MIRGSNPSIPSINTNNNTSNSLFQRSSTNTNDKNSSDLNFINKSISISGQQQQPFKFTPSPVSSPTTNFPTSNFGGNRLNISLTHHERNYSNGVSSGVPSVSNNLSSTINRKNVNIPMNFSPIRGAANSLFKKSWRNSNGGFCCNFSHFILGIVFFISFLSFIIFVYYSIKMKKNNHDNDSNNDSNNPINTKHSESTLILSTVQDFFTRLRTRNDHRLKNIPLEEGYSQYFDHERADQETLKKASDKLTKEMKEEMQKVKEFYKKNPISKVFVAIVNDHSHVMSALILAKRERLVPTQFSLPILHVDSHSGHKINQQLYSKKHQFKKSIDQHYEKHAAIIIEKNDINNFISTSQYYDLLGGHVVWIHNDWEGSHFSMPRGRHTAILANRLKKGKAKICYKNMRGIFWDGTVSELTFETMVDDESGKIYKNEKAVCSKSEKLKKQKHVRWDVYSIDQISRLNHQIFNNTPYILHLNEDFFTSSDPTLSSLLPRDEFGHLFDMLANLLSPSKICYSKPIKIPTKEGVDKVWTNEEHNREWISKILDELFFKGLLFEKEGTRAPRFSFYSHEILEMWCGGPKVALEELKKINKLVLIILDNIPFYTLSLLRYEYDFPTIHPNCNVNNLFGVCPSMRSPAHESTDIQITRASDALKNVLKREGLPALVIISRANREGFITSDKLFDIEHTALKSVERGLSAPMLVHYLNAEPLTKEKSSNTQLEQEYSILEHVIEQEMEDLSVYAPLMSDRIEKFKQIKKFIKYKELKVIELFYEGQDLLKEFVNQLEENLRFENAIVKTPYQSPKTRIKICVNMIGVSKLIPPYLKCLIQRMRQEKRINFLISEKLVETEKEFREIITLDVQIAKVSNQVKEDKFILMMDLGCDNVHKVLVQTERGLNKYFTSMETTTDGKLIHDIMQTHSKTCRK